MTRSTERNDQGHRTRVRTLRLNATPERALMGKAYETYASAQAAQKAWHNEWRRLRKLYDYNDDVAVVQVALKKATEAAFYLTDAKTQYHLARVAAETAGRAA